MPEITPVVTTDLRYLHILFYIIKYIINCPTIQL